jgi:serine/threonine protein kinase
MHRNLKPDNILVSDQGKVILTDFTSSRVFCQNVEHTPEDPKERERSGREAKRLWYKAPELLYRTKKYGYESDVWQVGCLLTEIALGTQIFNGSSEIENLFKIFKFTGRPDNEIMEQILD